MIVLRVNPAPCHSLDDDVGTFVESLSESEQGTAAAFLFQAARCMIEGFGS